MENLQETMFFPMKHRGFLQFFPYTNLFTNAEQSHRTLTVPGWAILAAVASNAGHTWGWVSLAEMLVTAPKKNKSNPTKIWTRLVIHHCPFKH